MSDWPGIVDPITRTEAAFRPGRRVRYVENHRSFGKFMRSEQMRDVTAEVAADIAERAAALSPVDTTQLREGYEVERESGVMKVSGNLRVQVNVVNETPWAAANEFGGKKNKRHRMLGRAGAEFGDLHAGEDL